ncbi:hypothetical protein KQI69_00565 [Eubacterium sp. MSJ-13]|uniref:hypothetical protein n=1 Tax=Eubacterium sp. MSJ-13 TaxID=2841513 RepID=UPI001C11043B|nr:hypothetical protein [Eubacterium sp. MSJ-13]MBU5477693.1 hypothetical protein [Eubacterium sp. MSJ-13]
MYELKIKNEKLLNLLQRLPEKLPETGGIIGGKNQEITEYWVDDDAVSKGKYMCRYTPNVDVMNEKIHKWSEKNIDFLGIFHTHYFGIRTLSKGDIEYMYKIMNVMPLSVKVLYFPIIVFPEKEMILYAIKNQTMEIIQCDYYII